MKPASILPDRERKNRIEATTPTLDAWVSANAGSGKTTILKNRVIRLLLDGVAPDRILCLTFTKAAAAEMQGRIFDELARWVGLGDAGLTREIAELVTLRPDAFTLEPWRLKLARTLFARAIEAPGGLKIQTIHAFAERVLHLFPLEAGVPLDFSVLGEADADALRHAARQAAIETAIRHPASPLGKAFNEILAACGTDAFAKALEAALEELSGLAIRNEKPPAVEHRDALYAQAFGVPAGETDARIDADFTAEALSAAELESAAAAIRMPGTISPTQERLATDFAAAGLARGSDQPWQDAYLRLFLTKGMEAKKSVFAKPVLKVMPELADLEVRAKAGCMAYLERRRAFKAFNRSRALLLLAEFVLDRFTVAKRAQNALDFDDLIAALWRLLHSGQANWMMMKLDSSIEHVLVDEAQDTTREMWDIIKALTDDFFAGKGQSKSNRSVFVVGDEKQSIFSFQGADPSVFDDSRLYFAGKSITPKNIENPIELHYSFRSSDDILRAVDAVYSTPERAEGLTASGQQIQHVAAKEKFPGLVEIWPLERAPEAEAAHENSPSAAPGQKDAAVRLAESIADRIAVWLETDARHLSDGKPIRPGDILILVQHRNAFFYAMLRALKRRMIPVAGADRLKLQDEIAVRDFLVITEAVLLQQDDLALATALRSPLFGLSEVELENLARHRAGSLWEAVQHARAPKLVLIADRLHALSAAARVQAPFEFFSSLLTQPSPGNPDRSGRQAILTRLGPDAGDPIDAFLIEALEFSKTAPGSVLLFVQAQRDRKTVIKRDLDQGGNQVRVMTVHGSKGLEGRIVFLGDTVRTPDRGKEKTAFLLAPNGPAPLLCWAGSKDDEPEAMRDARLIERRKILMEYRRLLYVAMTRAADRLYISGYAGKITDKELKAGLELPPPGAPLEWSWYQLLRAGLAELPGMIEVQSDALPRPALSPPIRRLVSKIASATAAPAATAVNPATATTPDWLARPLETPAAPLPPLRPSNGFPIEEQRVYTDPISGDRARRRGVVLHQLYEWLPRVAEAERTRVGTMLLAREAPELDLATHEAALAQVVRVLASPEGRHVFGPGSRAEVALAGRIALPDASVRDVAGRIDRLVISETGIEIVDLKTGHPHPAAEDHAIVRQMALYRALLQAIYPDRVVTCLVLWTEDGTLDRLPDAALDAMMLRIAETKDHEQVSPPRAS